MILENHFETAPLSANERIAEFLDFAIQAKFAYVNKLGELISIRFFEPEKRILV